MTAKRILYVNYNPVTLIRDEQWLMRAGYEVDTVLGTDGVTACASMADYGFVLIGEACPLKERKKLLRWLTANFTKLIAIPPAEAPPVCRPASCAMNQITS